MKKYFLFAAAGFCALSIFNANSSGPAAGHTGSPGDGQVCTKCHSGSATDVAGLISTNIPSEGYEPGKSYEVTFSISEAGVSKFGFQMTSEDGSNAKKGTFVATAETQLKSGTHITHKSSSTSGSGSKSWKVNWTAPAAGTGDVTFYGAGNASDGMSNTSGDKIVKSSLKVKEKTGGTTGLILHSSVNEGIAVFPNPALNTLYLNNREDIAIRVLDLNGQERIQENLGARNPLDVSGLEKGIYFIEVQGESSFLKFVKE
jgi:hypothetical protein